MRQGMANFWKMTVEHNGDTYPFLPGEKETLIVQGPDSYDENKVKLTLKLLKCIKYKH